ncbi:MBL fold metallo-hydrolase [Ferdinandcohnia quinoae]|uniref:MBL fold metallo-hydrolase n=1 Tax=Fredinandcohnia quinoae TaxID=2918902 RepID=A0AAW5E7E6_9BACI|nr:MBL fold metallo-hydrolase [Fredinandcohnia sp. SECRCQ15]MCH1626839.1 MBL fold metallo-hydrolase [Fredinandcohnia sp. SECRCQ15]
MKVTVIGFWGGFPAANEATSGYLIEHDGYQLLVDCGSGVLSQLQNFIKTDDLDAIILSHYHHDHVADIGPIQYARIISNSMQNKSNILPIYAHTVEENEFNRLTYEGSTKAIPYEPNKPLQIGPYSITFMKTNHPAVCYAMRISAGSQTVVYTADSSYLDEFIPFAKDADLFICECNMYAWQDGSKYGHMSSTEAGLISKNANVKELWITHLPHHGNHQDLIIQAREEFNGKIQLAKTGLTWE